MWAPGISQDRVAREKRLREWLKKQPIGELPLSWQICKELQIPETGFARYMKPHRDLGTVVLRGKVWFKVGDFYD